MMNGIITGVKHYRRYSSSVTMNIFDRSAKLKQKARALTQSDDPTVYDYLKEEVGYRLADRVFDIKREFNTVVDLGCGRGYVSRHVQASSVSKLIMCDICEGDLNIAKLPEEEEVLVEKKVVDEEFLPFEKNSVDLVLSSLSLHWVNDLPSTFFQVLNCLKPDGAFIGSVFGGDTLYQLRSALQLAETERSGGLSAHISPFTDVRDIGALLNAAGFTMLTIDADEITVNYPTMFELLHDLKGMGESNCAWRRPPHLGRETLWSAAAIYKQLYGNEDSVPATFQILYFLGWKPDPSQPKPAARGSATHSLVDLDKVISGITKPKAGKK